MCDAPDCLLWLFSFGHSIDIDGDGGENERRASVLARSHIAQLDTEVERLKRVVRDWEEKGLEWERQRERDKERERGRDREREKEREREREVGAQVADARRPLDEARWVACGGRARARRVPSGVEACHIRREEEE